MENSEQQIAVIKNIVSASALTYDLYLMEKRLVAIHTGEIGSPVGSGGFVGQLVAEGIHWALDSRRKNKMKSLTLDDLLGKDKRNFAITYENVRQIKLYDDRELEITSLTMRKTFKLTKDKFEQLLTVLPTVNLVKEKLILHAQRKTTLAHAGMKECVQCGKAMPLASEECSSCGTKQP